MLFRLLPRLPRLLLCAGVALSALVAPASAQFLGRSADEVVQITLMPGYRVEAGRHMAALRITLAPGWKTYWRAPGDGGVPTVVRLSEADGVRSMAIHWPRPEVFFASGLRSIGYRDDVVIPIEFVLDGNGSYEIAGEVDLGVCQDVCMPISVDLAGILPPTTTRDAAISAALADRPFTASEAGVGRVRCAIEPIADGLRVTVTAELASAGNDETLVVEHRDPMIWVSSAVTERRGGTLTAVADVVPEDNGPFVMSRADLILTVIGSQMAVDLGACSG